MGFNNVRYLLIERAPGGNKLLQWMGAALPVFSAKVEEALVRGVCLSNGTALLDFAYQDDPSGRAPRRASKNVYAGAPLVDFAAAVVDPFMLAVAQTCCVEGHPTCVFEANVATGHWTLVHCAQQFTGMRGIPAEGDEPPAMAQVTKDLEWVDDEGAEDRGVDVLGKAAGRGFTHVRDFIEWCGRSNSRELSTWFPPHLLVTQRTLLSAPHPWDSKELPAEVKRGPIDAILSLFRS